jgi:pyruvate, water dikinase
MPTTPYIQFFDADEAPDHSLLGGKCASLQTMTRAGMPVPPGFTVTTAAFDAFVEHAGLADERTSLLASLDPDDISAVDAVSSKIRECFLSCDVPPELRMAVVGAYEALQQRFTAPVAVAVRSSATAEDLPGASFAGQQDTYLWINGIDSVLDHIRQCWASLYTSRAILYRLKNAISDDGLSMAVAVQKMVNARAAGVAITMNPTNGDRSKIAIDASYGVGEMVVSGLVTPDNMLLDKVMMTVVSQTVGDKHAQLIPDFAAGRLIEVEVAEDKRRVRCLDDAEVAAVAQLAKRAEKHYGCPQDVEWAIDNDLPNGANVLLLQSRPETVHSAKKVQAAPITTPRLFNLPRLTSTLKELP